MARVRRLKKDPIDLRNLVEDPDPRKPFIQLRWDRLKYEAGHSGYQWICYFELVIPLARWDCRREDKTGKPVRTALVIKVSGPTRRGSDKEPCRCADGSLYYDLPFRDGAHAVWDAQKLGGLEVVVVAIDGTVIRKPSE